MLRLNQKEPWSTKRLLSVGGLIVCFMVAGTELHADVSVPEPTAVFFVNANDNTPPSVPETPTTFFLSAEEIVIDWESSTDEYGVRGYRVYRNGEEQREVSSSSFHDRSVTTGGNYSYTVVAFDGNGNESAVSPELEVNVPAPEASEEDLVIVEPVPNALWFRRVAQFGDESQQIRLNNWGKNTVNVSDVVARGNGFSIVSAPTTISPGGSVIIQVRFAPTSATSQFEESYLNYEVNGEAANPIKLWGSKTTSSPEVVNLSSCGPLNQEGATYRLTANLTSDGSCLAVRADDIALDLNGHTITYGRGGANNAFGIVSAPDWANLVPDNMAGGSMEGLHIYNGKVEQYGYNGTCTAGEYGHGIFFHEVVNSNNILIENMEVNVCGKAAINIQSTYRDSIVVRNSQINSKTTEINNRHQMEGMLVKFRGNASNYNHVYGNRLVGGAQGGIYFVGHHNQAYDNYLSQDGRYTNGFGIVAGYNGHIFQNEVKPLSGRGIRVARGNNLVHHNEVEAKELDRNTEYGGCPIGGGYGIQIEEEDGSGADGNLIFNNDITAFAEACMASAVRATGLFASSTNIVFENRIYGRRVGDTSEYPSGYAFSGVQGGIEFRDNEVFVDGTAIYYSWSAGQNIEIIGDTFSLGSNPLTVEGGLYFALFDNTREAETVLRDVTLEAPLTASLSSEHVVGGGDWRGSYEYMFEETVTVRVDGMDGREVRFLDGDGSVTASGVLEAGEASIVVPCFRYWNTTSASGLVENILPSTVQIVSSGIEYTIVGDTLPSELACTASSSTCTPN